MMKLVVLAVLVAAVSAYPGGLLGGYGGGLDDGAGLSLGHGVAVAAPVAIVKSAPATSYANSNLLSKVSGVAVVQRVQPVAVKTYVAAAPAISLGHDSYGSAY